MRTFDSTLVFMANYFRQWFFCLKHYALMCVFASGPDRLPYNPVCIIFSVLVYFLLGFTLVDEQRSYGIVTLQILLEILLLVVVAYLGLKWKKKISRFAQTFSALVGVNLIISAVMLALFDFLPNGSSSETGAETSLLSATLLMIFWNLAVISQILKRAFEINTMMSAMIAFNYFFVYQFLVFWFNLS